VRPSTSRSQCYSPSVLARCTAPTTTTNLSRLVQLRGASALLLGISISLDQLAIGFTVGLLRRSVDLECGELGDAAFFARESSCARDGWPSEIA
jgi:hypothetical protein